MQKLLTVEGMHRLLYIYNGELFFGIGKHGAAIVRGNFLDDNGGDLGESGLTCKNF